MANEPNRTTIYTLAEELGVSIAAISRAFDPNSRLSEEKRTRILEAAARYGYRPNKMASRLSMPTIRIGVLDLSYIPAYSQKIVDGIVAAYHDLRDYKITCDLRLLQRGEHSLDEAMAVLDDFLAQGCDGVVISGIYEDRVVEKIARLTEAGIKVAAVQFDLAGSGRLIASLSDYRVSGAIAAQLCGMMLRGSKVRKTVLFTGNSDSPTHRQLTESFREAAPRWGLEVAAVYDTADLADVAAERIRQAFAEHPDLAAIYTTSANSLPICRHLAETDRRDIAFVASDVFAELLPYLADGTVDATIDQEPHKMGYTAFDRLYHAIADNTAVPETILLTPSIVLAANVEQHK